VKETLKRILGPQWRSRVHRLSRLRWLTKYRLMRSFHARVGLNRRLGYVLLDPETESFSFELENEPQLLAGLADALDRPEPELAAYAAETHSDPELGARLTHHIRWQFDVKHHLPLGNRLAWYVLARAMKPKLVVETGIYQGLGSLALLRALERNRQEGIPGELMSFDLNSHAGAVVRPEIRGSWWRLIGSTHELMLPALAGRRVDMLFQDTDHSESNQRFEFGMALSHAPRRQLLLDGSGGYAPTLKQLCREHAGAYHQVPMRSRAHIFPGGEICFALFQGRDR
jgi:predicted O-methyltransferase YrrM